MEKQTYWQILKSSKRFFTHTPIAFERFTEDMVDGAKAVREGITEIATQLTILVIWLFILITFPITIPVSAAFIYFRQDAAQAKINAEIDRLHEAMEPNQKKSL